MNAQDTISQAVKYMLKRDRKRQKDLAAELGVSESAVTMRMRGHTRWTSIELDVLAAFFDEPLSVFLIERVSSARKSVVTPRYTPNDPISELAS